MIVVAIIGILAAVAIPGYVGFQNKSRRGAMERAGQAAKYELQGWITAARSVGTKANLIEVDTNYDGEVTSSDKTNASLRALGVASTYIAARSGELSPFAGVGGVTGSTKLWAATNGDGQISLVDASDTSGVVNRVNMTGRDNMGNNIFVESVTSD